MANTDSHQHEYDPDYCIRCKKRVEPIQPPFFWKIAVAAAWGMIVTMLLGVMFVGIGVTMLAPGILLIAAFTLAPLHESAAALPHCPECHRAILPERKPRTILDGALPAAHGEAHGEEHAAKAA